MDRQEVFNTVYTGLAGQGFHQSLSATGECMYRGIDNRRCAAGWVIEDSEYNPDMETIGIAEEIYFEKTHKRLEIRTYSDKSFLEDLQRIHDNSHISSDMKKRLIDFAHGLRLTVPKIKGDI